MTDVGGLSQARFMRIGELLDHPPASGEALATGFDHLDRLTGGLPSGGLWVITGAPGTGKTTLLTQLVYKLAAEHGFAVRFQTAGSDCLAAVRERFLALASGRPRGSSQQESNEQGAHVRASLAILRDAPLQVDLGRGWYVGSDWGSEGRACLAIDEPEFGRPPVLAREGLDALRRFADRQGLVLVTVPRSHCLERGPYVDRLREDWASVSDVSLELVPIDDMSGAPIRVLRNRHGPTGDVSTVLQAHHARFVSE